MQIGYSERSFWNPVSTTENGGARFTSSPSEGWSTQIQNYYAKRNRFVERTKADLMQTELDALRLILAKEHSFSPDRRYLRVSHDQMVPLLIMMNEYFLSKPNFMTMNRKRFVRLSIMSKICEANFNSFYEMTFWQISSITNYLSNLEEEEHGKSKDFLKFVEESA